MQKTKLIEENPYLPKPYKVLDFYRETHDNFTLKVNMSVKHEPGQFVQVSVQGFGECPISICSDSEKFIELNIREVGNATNALSKLRKGDTIFIRGPYGNSYPMKDFIGKDLVVIGGGCGVAPLKSVIDYVENHKEDYHHLYLIFGYRSAGDIIFRKDIEKWKKKYKVYLTLDKKAHGKLCYNAKQGFVTDALKALNLINENKIVFICGPPIMMRSVIDILKQENFRDEQIYVSAERLMYCAIGICCHCMIRGKFTCVDGPVFRYDEIGKYKND